MDNRTLSRRSALGYLLGSLCLFACTSTQAAEVAYPAPAEERRPVASRELLEFLAEFSELDDTEFDLLTAYSEQDAEQDSAPDPTQEPKDSSNE